VSALCADVKPSIVSLPSVLELRYGCPPLLEGFSEAKKLWPVIKNSQEMVPVPIFLLVARRVDLRFVKLRRVSSHDQQKIIISRLALSVYCLNAPVFPQGDCISAHYRGSSYAR